ncbi:MAG: protein DA1 [Bacteroidales bacterium]|nr:protein DA1 [Bacteroidales bacterium]
MEECIICHKEINGSCACDQWHNVACKEHLDNDEIAFCSACGSFVRKSPLACMADGRYLCDVCITQTIRTTQQIADIKKDVAGRLHDNGIVFPIDITTIPIEIVNMQKFGQLLHCTPTLTHKGLTLTKSYTSIGGNLLGIRPKLSHQVYILDNLIRVDFSGVLAHEMMHIWQHENNIKLAPKQCEGLCNLASWLVYDTMVSDMSKYFMEVLKTNADPIYGDGFRYVFEKYERLGLAEVLSLARSNRL